MYEIDWKRLDEFLREHSPSSALVVSPPGLWREADEVCKEVTRRGIECIRSAVPVFGACLSFEHFGGDVVIHLGHYPYRWWRPKKPTLYLECPWKGSTDWSVLKNELKGRKVMLGAPAQHVRALAELKEYLEREGFEVSLAKSNPEGLILGCDYYGFVEGFDEYVVVSGGQFHSIGAALFLNKEIVKFDPYTNKVERVSPNKFLMKRMWKVKEAMEGKRAALIDGIEGQSRIALLKSLKELAEANGFEVKVFRASILTRDFMVNVLEEADFAVVLSCPRMPLDDFEDLHKPVLAPGEAKATFKRDLEAYSFPW